MRYVRLQEMNFEEAFVIQPRRICCNHPSQVLKILLWNKRIYFNRSLCMI